MIPKFVSTDFNANVGNFTSTQSDYSEWRAGDKIIVCFLTSDDVTFNTFGQPWQVLDHRPRGSYWATFMTITADVDNPAYSFQFSAPTVFAEMTLAYRDWVMAELFVAVDGLTIPQATTRLPNEQVLLFFGVDNLTKIIAPAGTTERACSDNSMSPALQILVADQEKAQAGTVGPYAAQAPGEGVSYLLSLVGSSEPTPIPPDPPVIKPPTITILSPAPGSVHKCATPVVISAHALDGNGVDISPAIQWDNGAIGATSTRTYGCGGPHLGSKTVTARITDPGGTAQASVKFTVKKK